MDKIKLQEQRYFSCLYLKREDAPCICGKCRGEIRATLPSRIYMNHPSDVSRTALKTLPKFLGSALIGT